MIEVQQYIETFKDYPLLSPKEERRLLEIIRTPPEGVPEDAESWTLTPEQVEARDLFIYSNIRLVIHNAKMFCKLEDPRMMDLICAGVFGMVHALSKFDISLGYRFSTFAMWWIRAKIGNELKAQDSKAIRYKTLQQKFKKCRNQHMREGIYKSEEDIFKELEWTEVEINRFKEDDARLSISLDTIDTSLNDFASCDEAIMVDPPQDEVLERIHREEQIALMKEAFKALTPEQERIVRAYYGLDGDAKTYDQLELETGIPRERIRKMENRALAKMWRHMRQKAPSLCE